MKTSQCYYNSFISFYLPRSIIIILYLVCVSEELQLLNASLQTQAVEHLLAQPQHQ